MSKLLNLNIYKFESFHAFINEWVQARKNQNPSFSLGKLAKDLELSSTAEIANILKNRRPVSHKVLNKFAGYLKLDLETEFYLNLIAEKDRNSENKILNLLINDRIAKLNRTFSTSV